MSNEEPTIIKQCKSCPWRVDCPEVEGDQHETFDDTLPKPRRRAKKRKTKKK
jgi:hypothetical protein